MRPVILVAGLLGIAAVAGALGFGLQHLARPPAEQADKNIAAGPHPHPPAPAPVAAAPAEPAKPAGATALLAPASGAATDRLSAPPEGGQITESAAAGFSALKPIELTQPLA